MKKILAVLLIAAAINMFSGCSNNTDTALNKEGVQPYTLSEREKELLQSLSLKDKVNIISFKAPKAARSLQVNTYILGEDKTWQANGGGKISMGKDSNPADILEGTFAMLLKENYKIEMHINTSVRYSYQTDELVNNNTALASAIGFLMEFKEIELNKEIPVAIMIYDSSTSIRSYGMENFFSPTDFAEMDLVQAVTLTFTDEAD